LLERLAFPCGYGVEIAMLIDTLEICGLEAMAQVDLGVRHHRNQDDAALGRMAAEVWQAALARLPDLGQAQSPAQAHALPDDGTAATLTQYERAGDGFRILTSDVGCIERPPMITVPEYLARHAARTEPGATAASA
jgi:glucosyl-3-phosphoglycerate synthase